jgi:hypothetical protein
VKDGLTAGDVYPFQHTDDLVTGSGLVEVLKSDPLAHVGRFD